MWHPGIHTHSLDASNGLLCGKRSTPVVCCCWSGFNWLKQPDCWAEASTKWMFHPIVLLIKWDFYYFYWLEQPAVSQDGVNDVAASRLWSADLSVTVCHLSEEVGAELIPGLTKINFRIICISSFIQLQSTYRTKLFWLRWPLKEWPCHAI